MRRRLTLAIVGVVAGALVVAGLGSLLLVRRAAGDETRAELVRQAEVLAQGAEEARRPGVIGVLRQVLRLEGFSVVRLSPDGRPLDVGPSGLDADDLETDRLLRGETVSGRRGSMAFAAAPIQPQLRPPGRNVLAVVLTRDVTGVRRGAGYFAVAAGLALLVALVVADRVGRRISEPLARAESATRDIAAGDLGARVPDGGHSYPELASLSRSINAMAADLDRARNLERQFLLSVSHDLRTPLTSIRGFAEAIADGVTDDSRRPPRSLGRKLAEWSAWSATSSSSPTWRRGASPWPCDLSTSPRSSRTPPGGSGPPPPRPGCSSTWMSLPKESSRGPGLAIVAELMAAMGGSVEAHSERGSTRMVVTLPEQAPEQCRAVGQRRAAGWEEGTAEG